MLIAGLADIDLSRSEADAALRALPQLTSLHLRLPPPLPQAVTGLVQLRRFTTDCCGTAPPDVLPGGPWLASLREVTLSGPVTVSTIQVLQAATRLESLEVGIFAKTPPGEADRLLQFASQHPTLQQLELS